MAVNAQQSVANDIPARLSTARAANPTNVDGTAANANLSSIDEVDLDAAQNLD